MILNWKHFIACLVDVLQFAREEHCDACTLFLCETVQKMCADIRSGASGRNLDIRKLHHVASASKRRRVDVDFKKFATEDAIRNKKAHNSGQVLRGCSDILPGCGLRWEREHVSEQLAANRNQVSATGVCSIIEDAGRNSKPGEDTNVFFFWSASAGLGCVLPFQVRRFLRYTGNLPRT